MSANETACVPLCNKLNVRCAYAVYLCLYVYYISVIIMLGKGGVRWPGLSISLDKTKYGTEWLQSSELGIQQVWNQQVYVYT